MVLRIESGRPVAHVAAEMGISRPTAYKWWNRWAEGGSLEALTDRSSRPRSCPHQTPPEVEAQIAELRQLLKLGPARIGGRLGVPASTVHRVLVRLGLNRLAWIDRPTGQVIRRIHTERPGELVHIDVKKLGRIPEGGGWRAHGRENRPHRKAQSPGYAFVQLGHRRLQPPRLQRGPRRREGPHLRRVLRPSPPVFAEHRIDIDAVLTDNAKNYLGKDFTAALGGIEHRRIRRYRPQTNGKVERFNRTLLEEWAYVRVYRSEAERTAALDDWLHLYNHHRHHTAIDGAPITRVNNLPGHYS